MKISYTDSFQRTQQPEVCCTQNFLDAGCLEYINHLKDTEKWTDAFAGGASIRPTIRVTKNIIIEEHNDSHYLYKSLEQAFKTINDKSFHYHISSIHDVSILKYEAGCFYKPHLDIGGWQSDRKISLIVQLSNPDSYTGCDTILHCSPATKIDKTFNAGTFFPSYLLHEATQLLTGTRYALVTWATGEPFR